MHNQLTEVDIQKMKEEIEYRITVRRPHLLKEVVRTRAFGDLSETRNTTSQSRKKTPMTVVSAICRI